MNKYEIRIEELREAGNLSVRAIRMIEKKQPATDEEWAKLFKVCHIDLEEKPEDPDFVGWKKYREAVSVIKNIYRLYDGSLEDDREAASNPMMAIAMAADEEPADKSKALAIIEKYKKVMAENEEHYKTWCHVTGADKLGG